MASNVFGTPVTVETLKGMPEYADKDVITRNDLANVALNLKNADGKDVQARKYVEDMYKGFEGLECVLGLIYNATGALLRYVYAVDFYGFVAPPLTLCSLRTANGGAFLYVKYKDQEFGAAGSVVYRGYDLNGVQIDYFVGWDNKVGAQLSKTYVEMGAEGAYNYNGKGFSELHPKVQDSGAQYTYLVKDGFFSTAMIKWRCLKSSTGLQSLRRQLLDWNRSILKAPSISRNPLPGSMAYNEPCVSLYNYE